MVARCANPRCSAEFRFLKEGKLFLAERTAIEQSRSAGRLPPRALQHFWLYDACCQRFTVVRDEHEIRLIRLRDIEHPAKVHKRAP
jgi:hypothetical protein